MLEPLLWSRIGFPYWDPSLGSIIGPDIEPHYWDPLRGYSSGIPFWVPISGSIIGIGLEIRYWDRVLVSCIGTRYFPCWDKGLVSMLGSPCWDPSLGPLFGGGVEWAPSLGAFTGFHG